MTLIEVMEHAQALAAAGRREAAIAAYRDWLRSHEEPEAYAAQFNLAVLYFQAGQVGLAQAALRACLKKNPGLTEARAICAEPTLDARRAMAARASYGHARLRIGWLGDVAALKAHPLTAHPDTLAGAGCVHTLFGWGEGLPAGAQNLSGRTDDEAACLIRTLEIDVLIDLMGWSLNARPGIVAYHPAALQFAWTPTPAPSGLAAVDYVIADRARLPQDEVARFQEPVLRLEPALPMVGESLPLFCGRVERLLLDAQAKLPARTTWTPAASDALKYLVAPRGRGRRYAILAPPYEHSSAGIRVLYDLQKWLTLAGEDALVVTWFSGYQGAQFADDIVIYPEVAPGNVVGAKRVVRYILNTPGKLGHGERTYAEGEVLVAYNQDLAPYADGLVLQVPSIEPEFNAIDCVRTHDTVYIGKGRDLGLHPADCIAITKTWPPSRAEVAQLLRSTRVLYTYDNFTMLAAEAQACGCEVKVIQPDGSISDCAAVPLPSMEEFRQQLHRFIQMTRTL